MGRGLVWTGRLEIRVICVIRGVFVEHGLHGFNEQGSENTEKHMMRDAQGFEHGLHGFNELYSIKDYEF